MKKDNRGMTLIELLIAITMLALISTPFLNSFLVSVRSNYKARNVLRATTVAQNLMEGIEAFSLEDICRQFQQSAEDTKLYLPHGYDEHTEFVNENGQKSAFNGEEFVPTGSNTYRFGIQGIEEDGIRYDALITIDASGYRYTGNAEEDKWAYNEGYSMNLTTMSEERDVIFSLPLKKDEEVTGYMGSDYHQGFGELAREWDIVISRSDNNNTNVSIAVNYIDSSDAVVETITSGKTVQDLNNLYLMYYPNYNSTATEPKDTFNVTMHVEDEFNLCLIKQKYDTAIAENHLIYSPKLNLKQKATEGKVTLRTNVEDNLYTESGVNIANKMQYYKEGALIEADEAAATLHFVDGKPQNLLGESIRKTPIFKTRVQIYPAGTYNKDDVTAFDDTEALIQLEN